jgi:hypothetical protein
MREVVGLRKSIDHGEYVLRFDDMRHAIIAFIEISALRRWPVEFVPPSYFHNVPDIESPFWTPNESCLCFYVMMRGVDDKFVMKERISQDLRVPDPAYDAFWNGVMHELTQALRVRFGDCVQAVERTGDVGVMTLFKVTFYAVTQADRVVREMAMKNGITTFGSTQAFYGVVSLPSFSFQTLADP